LSRWILQAARNPLLIQMVYNKKETAALRQSLSITYCS
jgi:hypothetical protein